MRERRSGSKVRVVKLGSGESIVRRRKETEPLEEKDVARKKVVARKKKGGRPKGSKNKKVLTEARRKELLARMEKLESMRREVMDSDPFWYFEPSDGTITERGKELAREFLRPDDIPARVDGQIDALRSNADILGTSGGNQSGK